MVLVLNHTVYSFMNISLSYKVVFILEGNNKIIFTPFGNAFLSPSKDVILKSHPNIYQLEQKEICYYNPRCFMSIELMFDDITMNIIRNKALEYHKKEVDFFLQILRTK